MYCVCQLLRNRNFQVAEAKLANMVEAAKQLSNAKNVLEQTRFLEEDKSKSC